MQRGLGALGERRLVGGGLGRSVSGSALTGAFSAFGSAFFSAFARPERQPAGRCRRTRRRRPGEDHVVAGEHVVGVELVDRDDVHLGRVAQREPGRRVGALEHHEELGAVDQAGQRGQRRAGRRLVAARPASRRRGCGRCGPGRRGHRAGRRPSSSWGCAGRSCAAAGRGRRHRRRTAARGSSPDGRGRCPSACRACGHRRGPRRGSWWSALPWRAAACWATTTWWISGMLTSTSKISAGRSTETVLTVAMLRPPGCFFAAVRSTTSPPLGPGMAPLTRIRPFSASTAWTVRFWTVTVSRPMRPAIRTPLKTRPGVAQAPMEPGLRWLRWAPWEAPTPWKP